MTPKRAAILLTLGGLLGLGLVVAGVALIYPPAAFIFAGAPLVAAGAYGLLRIDVDSRRPR